MQPYALCSVYGGRSSVKAVMPIGVSPSNGSALLALDLSIDPASYMALSDDDLRRLLSTKASSPLVTIKANRQPILLPLELRQPDLPPAFDALIGVIAPDGGDAASAQAILVNRLERIRRAEIITPGIVARLIAIAGELERDYPTSSLVEEQLYAGGFPSRMDTTLRDRMRGMTPAEFVRNIPLLRDHRLREFATRRAFMMFPEALPEQENERLKTLFADRIAGSTGQPWRTAIDAGAEIAKLRDQHADGPAQMLEHLDAIEAFIDQLFARAAIEAVGRPDPDDLNGLG